MPKGRKFSKNTSPVSPRHGELYQASLPEFPGTVAFALPDKKDATNTIKKLVVVTAPKSVPIVEFCSEIEEKDQPRREKQQNAEIVSLAVLKKLGFKTNTANSQVDVIQPSKDIPRATEVIFIGRDGVRYVYSGASSPESLRDQQFEAFLLSIAQSQSQVEMFYKYYSQTFLFALRFFVSREVTENLPNDVETQGRIMQIFSQYFSADNTENRAIIDFSNPEKIMVQSEVLNCYSNAEQELEPCSVLTVKLEVSKTGVEYSECGASALPKAILTEGVGVLSDQLRVAELLQQDFVQDEMLRLEPIDEQELQQIAESQVTDESTERPDIHKYPDPVSLPFSFSNVLKIHEKRSDNEIIQKLFAPHFRLKIDGELQPTLMQSLKIWLEKKISTQVYSVALSELRATPPKVNQAIFKEFLAKNGVILDKFLQCYREIDISAFEEIIKNNLKHLDANISIYHECIYEFDRQTQQLKFQIRLAITVEKNGIKEEIPGVVCINGILNERGEIAETQIGYTNQLLKNIVEGQNKPKTFEQLQQRVEPLKLGLKYRIKCSTNPWFKRSLNQSAVPLRTVRFSRANEYFTKGKFCLDTQEMKYSIDNLYQMLGSDFARNNFNFANSNRSIPAKKYADFVRFLLENDQFKKDFPAFVNVDLEKDDQIAAALSDIINLFGNALNKVNSAAAERYFREWLESLGYTKVHLIKLTRSINQYINNTVSRLSYSSFRQPKDQDLSVIQSGYVSDPMKDKSDTVLDIDGDTVLFASSNKEFAVKLTNSPTVKYSSQILVTGKMTDAGAELDEIFTSSEDVARLSCASGTVNFQAHRKDESITYGTDFGDYAFQQDSVKLLLEEPINELKQLAGKSKDISKILKKIDFANKPIDIHVLIQLRIAIVQQRDLLSNTRVDYEKQARKTLQYVLDCFDELTNAALIDPSVLAGHIKNASEDNLMKFGPYAFAMRNSSSFEKVSKNPNLFLSLTNDQHISLLTLRYLYKLNVKLAYAKYDEVIKLQSGMGKQLFFHDDQDNQQFLTAIKKTSLGEYKELTNDECQKAQQVFFGDKLIKIHHEPPFSSLEQAEYAKLKQRNLKHALTYPIELLQKIYNANKDLSFEWVKTSLLYQKLEKASFIEITQKWQRPSIQKLFRLDKSLAIDLMKSNLDAATFFMKNKKARDQIGLKNNHFQELYAIYNQNRVFINLLMEEKLYKGWNNEEDVEEAHLVKSGPFGLSKKVIPSGTFDAKMFAHLIRTQRFKEIPQIINRVACIRDSDNQVLTILFRALAKGQADHLNQDSEFFCGIINATTDYLTRGQEPSEEKKPAVLRIATGICNNYEMSSAVADYLENQFYATSDETQKERLLNSLVDLACIDRTGKIAEKMLETGFFRQMRGKHVSNHLTEHHLVKLLNAHSENESIVNLIVKEKFFIDKIKGYKELNSQKVINSLRKAKSKPVELAGKLYDAYWLGPDNNNPRNLTLTNYQDFFDAYLIFQANEDKALPKVMKYRTNNLIDNEVNLEFLTKLAKKIKFDNVVQMRHLFSNLMNSNFTLLEFIAKHQLLPIEKLAALLSNEEISQLVQLNYPIPDFEAKQLMKYWIANNNTMPGELVLAGTPFEKFARKARVYHVMVEPVQGERDQAVSQASEEEDIGLHYKKSSPKLFVTTGSIRDESSDESFDYHDILDDLENAEPTAILDALSYAITQNSSQDIKNILASEVAINKLFNLYNPNQSTNQLVTIIKAINCVFPNDFLEKIGAEKIKCIFDDTNNAEDFYELCLSKSIASFFMNHHEAIDKMYNFVPRIVADNENSILEWRAFIASFAADQNADENLDARTQIARKLTLSFPNIPEEFRTKLESEETYRAPISSK